MKHTVRNANSEQGTALIATLMFLLAMGVLSTALVFSVHNELRSSTVYKHGQQAMNIANAGVQNSIQWFQNSYSPWVPSTGYNLTTVPVKINSSDVLLAGQTGSTSTYPNTTVSASFSGLLGNVPLQASAGNSGVYAVNATLLKYQPAQFIDPVTFVAYPSAIERWRINSTGYWGAAASPLGIARITATIENSGNALFDRALWGINSVDLGGTMLIDSYDPALGEWNRYTNSGNLGAVGSNGSVAVGGTADVHGDMAYGPSASYSISGTADITGDIIHLAEPRYFPPLPSFSAGSSDVQVNPSASIAITPGSYKDVFVRGTLTLGPGTYYIDSLSVSAHGQIVISDSTTVFVKTSIDMEGLGVTNTSHDPSKLSLFYEGSSQVKMTGGSQAYMEVYAPNAEVNLRGNADFFGSFIGRTITITGNPNVHFSEGCLQQNLIQRPFRLITWAKDMN